MELRIRRLVAAYIDFFISCFISSFLVLIVSLGKLDTTVFNVCVYLGTFVITFVLKDLTFKNASIGKKILHIKILKKGQQNIDTITIIKRSIPLILLYPLEGLFILIDNHRLGDIWSKSEVVDEHIHY